MDRYGLVKIIKKFKGTASFEVICGKVRKRIALALFEAVSTQLHEGRNACVQNVQCTVPDD